MSNLEHDDEYEDFKKRRFLKIGVIVFSVIIATIWIVSLRFSFNDVSIEKDSPLSLTESSVKEELQDIFSLEQKNLEAEKEMAVKAEEKAFLQAMSVNISDKLKKDEANKIDDSKKMLVELEEKLKNEKNCPEYIDCMPSIGEPVNCIIPEGCENITQIAY